MQMNSTNSPHNAGHRSVYCSLITETASAHGASSGGGLTKSRHWWIRVWARTESGNCVTWTHVKGGCPLEGKRIDSGGYKKRKELPSHNPQKQTMSEDAIKRMMHELCDVHNGVIYVSREHLAAATKTRRYQHLIGTPRADRLRGWIAGEVENGRAMLLDPEGLEWMGHQERITAQLRVRLLQETVAETATLLKAQLEVEEAVSAVLAWATENEEPSRQGAPIVLRQEKRAQLRTARHRLWERLGTGAMDATILVLVMRALAYPEVDPKRGDWIQTAAQWALSRGWILGDVVEVAQKTRTQLEDMRKTTSSRDGQRTGDMILDLGEGWGSIGTAAAEMSCATIGVDRAGLLYQGNLHGHIRARVQIDFASPGTANLLQRVARKAEISLHRLLLVWLSPECTLLSRANVMNISRGCAHGPYTESPQNLASVTPQRLIQERANYADCKRGIVAQLLALEQEQIAFALENPLGSFFWELEEVKEIVTRNPGWTIWRVDQCAYGRKSRKPTRILINFPWEPQGITGNGLCRVGACGGTLGNTPGDPGAAQHLQQTSANAAQKRTRMGNPTKGSKGPYSVKAAKNRVETMLVQELIRAAQEHRSGVTPLVPTE